MKDHPYFTGQPEDRAAAISEDQKTLAKLVRDSGLEIDSDKKLSFVINHMEITSDATAQIPENQKRKIAVVK